MTGTTLNGNAYQWKMYITSDYPQINAIVVLKGSTRLGHLAIVKEVKESSIVILEQNYKGRYIVSEREIALVSSEIIGYITKY